MYVIRKQSISAARANDRVYLGAHSSIDIHQKFHMQQDVVAQGRPIDLVSTKLEYPTAIGDEERTYRP